MAFGLAVVLYVQTFPQLPDGTPGPGLFPAIIGALLVLFGLVLVVRYVRDHRRLGDEEHVGHAAEPPSASTEHYESLLHETVPRRTAWTNALSVIGSIAFYLVFANVLGFNVTMGVLLVGLMVRLGAGWRVAIPSAVAATAFLYFMFARILLVPLPHGFIW